MGAGFDLTFIEVMPLGDVGADRSEQFLPLTELRARLESSLTLIPSAYAPAVRRAIATSGKPGAGSGSSRPLTHNFCESCNRVRVTCTGTLYMCLGQEDAADLREPLRRSASDDAARRRSAGRSPASPGHDFVIARSSAPATERHMNTTGR